MLGKLNMDEFAMGSSNETSSMAMRSTRGEAMIRASDTGWLVWWLGVCSGGRFVPCCDRHRHGRLYPPACRFTGLYGIKPTYGRVSRWGVVAFASSLDQAGPMTKSVRDAAIMLEAMCSHDPRTAPALTLRCPTLKRADRRYSWQEDRHPQRIPHGRHARRDRKAVGGWRAMLKDAGAEIVDISLPHTKYALPATT